MNNSHLEDWSRLTNENTKHALVSAAYVGILSRSPQADSFITWLLAGAGATAALMISNITTLSSALTLQGLHMCLSLLALSAIFGLFAKSASIFVPVDGSAQAQLHEQMLGIMVAHGDERARIIEQAEALGSHVPEDMQIADVVSEMIRPLPFLTRWIVLFSLEINTVIGKLAMFSR